MVNGIVMAARTSRSSFSTSGRSRSSPEPPLHFTTFFTGQPKLMIEDVEAQVLADARGVGHHLRIGAEELRGDRMLLGVEGQVAFSVLVGLRRCSDALTPCELVNSVMISPQPPWLRMKRRKTVSVTPAMGASTVAGAIFTGPIENCCGKDLHGERSIRF